MMSSGHGATARTYRSSTSTVLVIARLFQSSGSRAVWENARSAQAQVLIDLASTTKVNSPCFCNSGKKFKKCRAGLIDLTRHV